MTSSKYIILLVRSSNEAISSFVKNDGSVTQDTGAPVEDSTETLIAELGEPSGVSRRSQGQNRGVVLIIDLLNLSCAERTP